MGDKFNDVLAMRMFTRIDAGNFSNPFYASLIMYLCDIGFINSSFKHIADAQAISFEKYLINNPDMFKKALKVAVKKDFDEEISLRYSFLSGDKNGNVNNTSFFKYKIDDDKLYIYDMMLSLENQALLEVDKINGYDVKDIIEAFRLEGYTDKQIRSLIQHKEILTSFGFTSNKYEVHFVTKNVTIDFNDPKIMISDRFFYKEHVKSSLLDKSNFNNLDVKSNKEIDSSYSYESNMKLLKILYGLSKSEKDLKMFEKIFKRNIDLIGYTSSNDTNVDWMYITTFFLMNKEETSNLPMYVYNNAEKILKSLGRSYVCFLDENNEITSYGYDVDETNYGSNDYVFHDGKIDTKLLFHGLRDAIAHSTYEIVDKDYIRIYGYDNTGKLNCNLKINKELVLDFMDKLFKYSSFDNLFPICTLKNPNFDNRNMKNKIDLRIYLNNIVVSDVNIKSYHDLDKIKRMQEYAHIVNWKYNNDDILNDRLSNALEYDYVHKIDFMRSMLSNPMILSSKYVKATVKEDLDVFADYEYKELRLTDEQISRIIKQIDLISDTFYKHGGYNQHEIITELVKNELNPNRNITMIIEDIIDVENKEEGTLFDKLNEKSFKYIDYDKVVKASIISYLNNILLYNFNEKYVDCSELDFSKMDKDLSSLIVKKKNKVHDLIKQIRNDKKKLNSVSGDELINLQNIINEKSSQITLLNDEIINITDNGDCSSYIILEHLRNSLAHGNVFFSSVLDLNNLSDTELEFIDYKPKSNPPEQTFKGKIKLCDLIEALNNEKFIKSIFAMKEKEVNKELSVD